MKSMTGYGYSSYLCDAYQLEVEVKGYNNRYLDIQHNINYQLSSYEAMIDEKIKASCERGRVEVTVRLALLESGSQVSVDEKALEGYLKAFEVIKEKAGIIEEVKLSDILSQEGILNSVTERDTERYRASLTSCLDEALCQFSKAREREGEATKKDLYRLGESFKASNDRIGELVKNLEDYFKSAMLSKYKELLEDNKIDENRLLQEIGSLLVKYSINEEQNRLNTHIKEYFRLLESNEPVGKRLDFLCQEMNRETNTTASKSQLVEVTLETVAMKDNLENIREQIRNIE